MLTLYVCRKDALDDVAEACRALLHSTLDKATPDEMAHIIAAYSFTLTDTAQVTQTMRCLTEWLARTRRCLFHGNLVA